MVARKSLGSTAIGDGIAIPHVRNQQISDFPLCNKSFNLAYSGHDL